MPELSIDDKICVLHLGDDENRFTRTSKTQQSKVDLDAYVQSLGSDELAELVMTQAAGLAPTSEAYRAGGRGEGG